MMRKISVVALIMLAACGRPAPDAGESVDPGNPLEMAARERGVVRPKADELTGVFERRHELGRDAMCVVPDGEGHWRFALTAAFGAGLSCPAQGRITPEGEGWRLRFNEAEGCEVVVREEEDELQMPGNLAPQCDNLCANRASLAGLRLPRASWSEADAKRLQIRNRDGNIERSCGS